MKPILLSICVCSIHQRLSTLHELLSMLNKQERIDEVEILVLADSGLDVIGSKRNRLVAQARGQYVAHIDDDDLVDSAYIPKMLAAIDQNPGVDAVALRGRRTENGGQSHVLFDYRLNGDEGVWVDGVLWRGPSHLCAIRSEIVKSIPFPIPAAGEDLAWGIAIKPFVKTIARAGLEGEILYHYRWDSTKTRHHETMPNRTHQQIFTPQYTEFSGPGSTFEASAPYREFLSNFIEERAIRSILDLGCGDLVVMSNTDLHGASYHGIDCIPDRIARNAKRHPEKLFSVGDIQTTKTGDADLVVCKDVVQHWSTPEILAWLEHLKTQPFKYALVTNCNYGATVNLPIHTGSWRAIDLTAPPFSIGTVVFRWDTKDVVLIKGNKT